MTALLCSGAPPRPAAAARAADPAPEAAVEAAEAVDAAGARAPGATAFASPVTAAGSNLEESSPTDIVDM